MKDIDKFKYKVENIVEKENLVFKQTISPFPKNVLKVTCCAIKSHLYMRNGQLNSANVILSNVPSLNSY